MEGFLHKFVIKICSVVGITRNKSERERENCGWESEHLCIIKNIFNNFFFSGVIDCGKSVRKEAVERVTFVHGLPIL